MCDCEMPEFFEQVVSVARKRHTCCECYQPILKGQRYVRSTGKWDGEVGTYKTHEDCSEFRLKMQRGGMFCDCIPFGGIAEEIAETGADEYSLEWWFIKAEHYRASKAGP